MPPEMQNPLIQQIAAAATASKLLEWLKNWKQFHWISQHTKGINQVLSVLIALGSSAGFAVAWSGTVEAGGVLTIAVPSVSSIVSFLYHAVFAFVAQEGVYEVLIKRDKPPVVVSTSPTDTGLPIVVTAPPPGAAVVQESVATGVPGFDRWFSRFRQIEEENKKKVEEKP